MSEKTDKLLAANDILRVRRRKRDEVLEAACAFFDSCDCDVFCRCQHDKEMHLRRLVRELKELENSWPKDI